MSRCSIALKLIEFIALCCCLLSSFAQPQLNGYRGLRINSLEKPTQNGVISYKTKWFTQLIDHFTWANQGTYQQRYLVNDVHWGGDGSPILFYCGNEGDIEVFTNNTGWMWENAAQLKAMLVFAEHRFYGKSMPYPIDPTKITPNTTKTLGYLSSEQALADYARLIFEIKGTLYNAEHSPVIALGGSYGGMLAAWMRMKYPNAVAGALAASAPIFQFPGQYDCAQFNRIVTKDYENYHLSCAQNIARSWSAIRDLATKRLDGLTKLSSMFNTCKPMKDKNELELLLQMLNSIWVNMAMTDYANEASFLSKMPAYPIKHVCNILNTDPLKTSDQELIQNIARASQVYTNYTGSLSCLNIESLVYDPMDVLWDFQSCTEMVMPICSDGINDMFEPQPFNLDTYVDGCEKRWGVETQVSKVRTLYGGKDLAPYSKIIFSSGTRDPWSAGCPQNSDFSHTDDIEFIRIPNACHHEDLRASGPNDTQYVIDARKREIELIRRWVREGDHLKGNMRIVKTNDI